MCRALRARLNVQQQSGHESTMGCARRSPVAITSCKLLFHGLSLIHI